MTIPSLRFSKLPGIHLLSVLSFLKFCFYYFGFGSVIRLLKGLRFQLAVVWVAVFTAGDVQQHHLVVLVMVMFDAQLWLYAQLLVGDGRQHA